MNHASSLNGLGHNVIDSLRSLDKKDCQKAIGILNNRLEVFNQEDYYLYIKIYDLPLTLRASNALREKGLLIVRDVILYGFDNLWKIRNIGAQTEKEIRSLFKKIMERKDTLSSLSAKELRKELMG